MKTTSKSAKRHANNRPPSGVRVYFERDFTGAQNVSLAGTFNDWHPAATEMLHMGEGRWVKELVLPHGRYEYRLVVDGRWMADPLCGESSPNPFGGENSVLNL